MREITFRVEQEQGQPLQATANNPQLRISAASLEDLHHEAREALIRHFGAAHGAYRVRLQRSVRKPTVASRITGSPRRHPASAAGI